MPSLKALEALKTIERIVQEVFEGILRARRLNERQIIVEIDEKCQHKKKF